MVMCAQALTDACRAAPCYFVTVQMPVDQLILLVTLLSMAIVCLSVWWGIMRPPQLVLNICNSLTKHFSRNTDKATQLDTDAAPAEAEAVAAAPEEEELPCLEEKVAKHNSLKRPGSPSKVDSAVDLHQTGLRCMAVSALVEFCMHSCLYGLSNRAYSLLKGDTPRVQLQH